MQNLQQPVPMRINAAIPHADLFDGRLDTLTVDEAIAAWPSTAPVFNAYGLDLRRGRRATLRRAASEAGMSAERLVAELCDRLPGDLERPVGTR